MNIKEISKFIFKLISRSYILLFGIVGSIYFLTVTYINFVVNNNYGYINYIKSQEFSLLTLMITCSVSILLSLKLNDTAIEYLIKDKFKFSMGALIATIKLALLISLIPFSYIVFYIVTHKGMTMKYIGNGLVEFIFTYVLALVVISILMLFICLITNKLWKRLLGASFILFLTSPFNNIFNLENKYIKIILNILNIQDDTEIITADSFFAFNHDLRYIMDKVILIALIIVISVGFYVVWELYVLL